MFREAGLPVRLALVGFVLVIGFTARVAWVAVGSEEDEPGRVDVSQIAQKVPGGDNEDGPGGTQPRTPSPRPPNNDGELLSAGGPSGDLAPPISGGGCPKDFPIPEGEGCSTADGWSVDPPGREAKEGA